MDEVMMAELLPCSSEYQHYKNPYYIYAPDYTHKSAGIRLLHQLCSALNQSGYEAYVVANKLNGELWTPKLTEENKVAHYKANKKPVVIYPEVTRGQPMGLGVPVRYVLNYPGLLGSGEKNYGGNEIIFTFHQEYYPGGIPLYLPFVNIKEVDDISANSPRLKGSSAVYYNRYKPNDKELISLGEECVDVSTSSKFSFKEVLAILKSVEILYCFETSAIMNEAYLCGCAVVLLENKKLTKLPEQLVGRGMNGLSWGKNPADIEKAIATVGKARKKFIDELSGWQGRLKNFIEVTQSVSNNASVDECWPVEVVDSLAIPGMGAAETASKYDRFKYKKINQQYAEWQKKSTLREIDADIYAEIISKQKLPSIGVVISHKNKTPSSYIADTLDSVLENFNKASVVLVISEEEPPKGFERTEQLQWINKSELTEGALELWHAIDWIMLVEAGAILAPNALVEFALCAQTQSGAKIIYADEDVISGDGGHILPSFKPNINIELLRCSNYIGSNILVDKQVWREYKLPTSTSEIYGLLLGLSFDGQYQNIRHIDLMLVHGVGIFDENTEKLEFEVANSLLVASGLAKSLKPLDRLGTWLVEYSKTQGPDTTLVIPTGVQPGYMRQMLESLVKYTCENLAKIILICNTRDFEETKFAIEGLNIDVPIQILAYNENVYNHSATLNSAIASVETKYVWVCDDDIEFINQDALESLLSVAKQGDVACVEPRLLSTQGSDVRLVGGPIVLGIQGSCGPYLGEAQVPEESGYFSRLQLAQDVSSVSGHCFVFKKSNWELVNGFDEINFPIRYSVTDFCLRLNKLGYRHVWSPLTNVMHQGGKSLQKLLNDFEYKIKYSKNELKEKESLLILWGNELANDRFYNRHLSLLTPYDIETSVVIDWNPSRKDRPRVVASPLKSGAGQYRVVDPLEMLQDASLIQSSVIMPMANMQTRVLLPLELIRARPDALILQHSVDDAHLSLIEKYKKALPSIHIIQMVDDLLGFVPEKHPNRRFQSREGHLRMTEALKKSDSMIVTTEPLKHHYEKYVSNVTIIPNCLSKHWFELEVKKTKREKLRVGWIGAGQHQGDLEIINEVVKALADKVDWVFMGMHTAEVSAHIKEFHPFVSIFDYPKKIASLDLDIAVAPLEDNFFNSCKSNLRLLEYGAMSWAVICSDVYPYQTNNPPVVRVKDSVGEWLGALNRLIEDENERLRLGKALNTWVMQNYTLINWAPEWVAALVGGKS